MPRTVEQAAAEWIAVYVQTARSAKNVRLAASRVRDHLVPFMGKKLVTELRPDDFRRYRQWLQEKGLRPMSVTHMLSESRCLVGWVTESGDLERSPFPRRVMPRQQECPPDRLTDHEVAAVLSIPMSQAFVVRLALDTGMRWGEMCRATAADLERGMLVVHQTKSGRLRRIPLSPAMLADVRCHVGPLVPYAECSPGGFSRFVRHHSGVRRFHVHQLRHTFACRWIEAGGTLASLQQILGHASVVTTQRYARLSDDSVRREAERIHAAQQGPQRDVLGSVLRPRSSDG